MFFGKKKEKTIDERQIPENEREAEIYYLRYGRKQKKEKADLFMRAFMMINISYRNNLNGQNKSAEKKEIEGYLKQLGIIDFERDEALHAEWERFASDYLESCLSSSQYRSALSGMINYSDEKVANMIISDIDTALRKAPGRYGLDEQCRELWEIFRDLYINTVKDGREYWDNYMEDDRKNV